MLSDVTAVQPIKPRIYFLDVLKVLGTFLVVFAHLYSKDSTVRLYIYAFHMPLFYIISGLFHKGNGKINLKKQFQKLFIPAIFFCFLFLLLTFCVNCIQLNSITNAASSFLVGCKLTFWGFFRGKGMPNTVCWFLFSLFWCKLFADIYTSFSKKYKISFLIIVICLACTPFVPRYLYIKTSLMCFPFYILGYEFKDKIKALSFKWYMIPIAFICAYLCYLLTRLNGRVSIMGLYYGSLPAGINRICFYLNALIGSTSLLMISLFPFPQTKIVSRCSAALLTTVGIQKFFNSLFIQHFGINQSLLITTIATIIIMTLCFLVHVLLEKYIPFAVGAKRN